MHLTTVLETNLMSRRTPREGIGDGDSTVLVEMNKVLARERRGRFVNVEAEVLGCRRHIGTGRGAVTREATQDPEVELALRVVKPRPASGAELRRRNLGCRQGVGNPRRELVSVAARALPSRVLERSTDPCFVGLSGEPVLAPIETARESDLSTLVGTGLNVAAVYPDSR